MFLLQNDNDLVFEDDDLQVIRDQKPNNSSQVDSKYSNVVSLDNDILINTRDDRKNYEEPLSERISGRFDRFKRSLLDTFKSWGLVPTFSSEQPSQDATSTSTATEGSNTQTTRLKRSSVQTTRSRRQPQSK